MDDPAGEGSFHDVEPIVLDVLRQGGDVPQCARRALAPTVGRRPGDGRGARSLVVDGSDVTGVVLRVSDESRRLNDAERDEDGAWRS